MNWATTADLATAGGTLVLALATFGATRSANRTARLTEKALQMGLEPLLTTARPEDPPEQVMFVDNRMFTVPGGTAAVDVSDGNIYLAIPVRNVGNGIAVLKSWAVTPVTSRFDDYGDLDSYRELSRDLYIPSGGTGFWQGAIRDANDPQRVAAERALADGGLAIYIHYRDHYGGHRTVSQFRAARLDDGTWFCAVVRHFAVDRM